MYFGFLAIIGTHSGLVVDVHQGGTVVKWTSGLSFSLQQSFAIIGFRDLMVLTAGLFGGPWVGLGAGLMAGSERYLLGGFAGSASAVATVLQGLGAGLSRRVWPRWTMTSQGILAVSMLGTLLQKLIIFHFVQPPVDAEVLVRETVIPVMVINCLGCLLFMVVMKDLGRDRLKIQAQQAELRALQAQVEPHFLNNTLNAIHTLIKLDAEAAAQYVVKLARYFDTTRQTASTNSISLAQELAHLKQYLDFQDLRFPGKFNFNEHIPDSLLACQIPPRSLQTLVENALSHGMRSRGGRLEISVKGEDFGEMMALCVADNGNGIAPDRLKDLGKNAVASRQGGGSALFQLEQNLGLAFNGQARLDIHSQLEHGFSVLLHLPKRSKPW